ncbi:MAG: serine--tRNA ligase [Dehalococcoidia bacterium]|nr:serine--tRNA ligase [Dehalococcoidia bacterium]
MLSLDLIRNQPDLVRQAIARRHAGTPLQAILDLDTQRSRLLVEVEALRAERNRGSKEIARIQPRPPHLIEQMRIVGDRIKALDVTLDTVQRSMDDSLALMPNLPNDSVPDGPDSSANAVVRSWGQPRSYAFKPKPHWEIGPALGILDFERGQKISGSRFYVLAGPGAKLQRALIQWMLDFHIARGYREVYLPFMVRRQVVFGAGQLPKFADNLYHDAEEDFWMVPTAEVPITGLYAGEILPPDALPIHYVAYTACFRREKMSAGKDIRGMKRGHQFDKVELYKIVAPEESDAALVRLVADVEAVAQALDLPYRVVQLCTGDLGFAARESYDVEMWAPGCDEWLEVSSSSDCGDFQGRRANIRYRPAQGAKPVFVHTLNGSGLALPRVMISIMENYQQADGSVDIPKVLQPYTGFDRIAAPAA